MELLGQGQQGLAQQGDGLHPHGHLAPLGAEDHALHAHNVADVKLLEAVVLRLVHLVPPGVELDAAGLVLQVAEGHLAHAALGHEAAGDGHLRALQGVKIRLDVGAVVVYLILGDLKGIVPALLELTQLVPADLGQLGQVLLLGGGAVLLLVFGQRDHSYLLFPALGRSGSNWGTAQRSTFKILYSTGPAGASTTTSSPAFLPSRARPKGESSEMTPFMGSASWEPTIL